MSKNFAEIIPLRRLSRKLTVFDYRVPFSLQLKIKVGQLVQISFQKSEFSGVVAKIKENSAIPSQRLKTITKIIRPEPVLNSQQFSLLYWMAQYYFLAPSIILKSMIPSFPKRTPLVPPQNSISKTILKIPKKIIPAITSGINTFLKNEFTCYHLSYPQKTYLLAFYLGTIKKLLKKDKTILIIVPEISELNLIHSLLTYQLPKNKIAVVNSELTATRFFQEWQKVKNNKAQIILGTRLACFLPFAKLQVIIVHLEEDENHKQSDQNPRFHVREVATQLSRSYQATTLFTSQTPSLELLQQKKKGLIKTIDLPPLSPSPLTLVSLEEELRKKNYSALSEKLENVTRETLSKKKSVFLFINRRGEARSYLCQDCGWIARCSNCVLPFSVHEKNNLLCHHCGKKNALVLSCPSCQGNNLKSVGRGTQKVEQELKKLFPQTPVQRIDKDVPHAESIKGIIIGTEYAFRYLSLSDLGAIGIISVDNLLSLPDFRSEERTYQLITKIVHLAPHPVPVVIQTYSSENKTILSAVNQDFSTFSLRELIVRKKFHWPPYWHLIKLIYQNKDVQIAKKATEKLVDLFKDILKKDDAVEIMGPISPHRPRIRGKYRYLVILKTKGNNIGNLSKFIKQVPEDWIIDVDPVTLL